MFSIGDVLTTTIESLAFQGHGIAKPDGVTVFVPRTVPGDKVEIKITRTKKRFAFATCINIIEPSTARIDPPCALFNKCGGCQYQHITPQKIQAEKQQQLQDAFKRMGPGPTEIAPMVQAPTSTGYRNRITLRRDQNGKQGFVSHDTYQTIDVDSCLIAAPALEQAWGEIKPVIANINAKVMPFVTLRLLGEEVAVIFSVLKTFNKTELEKRFEGAPFKCYTTIIKEGETQAIGKDLTPLFFEPIYLEQRIGEINYIMRPDLFCQANNEVAATLVEHVVSLTSPTDNQVLDLYCGSGLFSIPLAKRGFDVYGVEVQYHATKCAKQSSTLNGTEERSKFQTGKADAVMQTLIEKNKTFSSAIVDPPRAGLHKNVIKQIPELGIEQLIYISCDPATLARDAKILTAQGYQIKSTTPFDMFPLTYHVETVCVFEKK